VDNVGAGGHPRDGFTRAGGPCSGARYYASNFGRFLSPDWSAIPAPVPYANLTNPQTLNLYAIVRDNPETFADLDGHCGQDWTTPCKNNGTSVKHKVPATGDGSVNIGDGTHHSPTQQGQQQTLTNAQDAAMNNPNYEPGAGGHTHCNQATCSVAKAMGAPMAPLTDAHGNPLRADQITANLAKSGSGYHQVSADQAQLLANQGKLVVVAGPGHVATVRPDTGQKVPGRGPLIANIGATNGVMRLNYVFRKSDLPHVEFYTPNQ
jgi:RHS repeat-associated protein